VDYEAGFNNSEEEQKETKATKREQPAQRNHAVELPRITRITRILGTAVMLLEPRDKSPDNKVWVAFFVIFVSFCKCLFSPREAVAVTVRKMNRSKRRKQRRNSQSAPFLLSSSLPFVPFCKPSPVNGYG
jgi:hypothetical protein